MTDIVNFGMNFGTANLIGGFIFGSVGLVAFAYGKRMNLWGPIVVGLALMIYPYFVNNDVILWTAGIVGSASLWFLRN